jgi:chloride channel 3/4/5
MDLTEQGYGKETYGDWVSETGLGARKYDDLTAIGTTSPVMGVDFCKDWIHEYTKERVRIRNMMSRPGVMSRIILALDSSQAWIILICTGASSPMMRVLMVGVSVGILAAAIDIVTDWLGDLKEGFCRPTFYLNRGFCCWGISGTTTPSPLGW